MMKYTKNPYIITPHPHFASWGDGAYLAPFCEEKIRNTTLDPLAELSYGSYPDASSKVENIKPPLSLHQLLHREANVLLGNNSVKELQFILKLIAVESPQPLHFHPTSTVALEGFRQESMEQRSKEDRFFLDTQVKDEILYSLQDDLILFAGFLPFDVIIERLEMLGIKSLLKDALPFQEDPSEETLKAFLNTLFIYEKRQQNILLQQITSIAEDYQDIYPHYHYLLDLAQHFDNDMAVILPLFLQDYHLPKGNALVIPAGSPHSILKGVALELSTTSLNTIRLALSHQRCEVSQWINTSIHPSPSLISHDIYNPDVPLPATIPLHLQVVYLEDHFFVNGKNPPLILLAIKGKARLSSASGNRYRTSLEEDDFPLTRGEALFLPHEAGGYQLEGRGIFVLAWSK